MLRFSFFITGIAIFGFGIYLWSRNYTDQNFHFEIQKETVNKLLEPYLQQAKQVTSRKPANSDEVLLIGQNSQRKQLPKLDFLFSGNTPLSSDELNKLVDYIYSQAPALGISDTKGLNLEFKSVGTPKNALYVHFRQFAKVQIGGQSYKLRVTKGSVVAKIQNGELREIYSKLLNPPDVRLAFVHPGIDFEFTDKEYSKFFNVLKTHPQNRADLVEYLNGLSRRSGEALDFESVLNRQVSEQKIIFNRFFSNLGKVATARIFIDLIKKDQLSLVKYGTNWMFQIDQFFDFPLQFDVEANENVNSNIRAINLRNTFIKFANIRSFENPQFPSGQSKEGGESAEKATRRMQQVLEYYSKYFQWTSFSGENSDDDIFIFTRLKNLEFRENAAWLTQIKKFVIGDGGQNLQRLNDSPSVIGHEFAHAILQHTSGLVYSGESGGINEHFSDIQGASVEAELTGRFDFTIGKDVLSPAIIDEKSRLLDLILKKYDYNQSELDAFNLNLVSMRHLYAPALSYATQYDHVKIMREHYPQDCQPSFENDNCGVHSISGVLNKASSLIIAVLGLEETRELFFNTVAYRLNSEATFEDYLTQLYAECEESSHLKNQCDVILASFAYVGIQHPHYPITVNEPPLKTDKTKIPAVDSSLTPELHFCGWVSFLRDENFQIFDDRYNVILSNRNNELVTTGSYSNLRQYQCACVIGRSAQFQQDNGEVKNLMVNVEQVIDRKNACDLDQRIHNKKPEDSSLDDVDLTISNATFCGWVSVNSRSRNIHVIDNKFDVAILASGYNTLTEGDYSQIYRHQCGCAIGDVSQTKNSKGTTFNYFMNVKKIIPRSYEDCIGLEWK